MTSREEQANNMLQNIARDIKAKLPEGFGFTLLAYEFGDEPNRRLLYVSNGDREDVCKSMLEFIEKTKTDYGKHKDTEGQKWYDLQDLLKLPLSGDTSIWCLNKHNYSDFLVTFEDLKKTTSQLTPEQTQMYQFTIVEKGDKNAK